jgi:hypothetical protein
MNHFTDAVKMVDQWRRATPQEAANGFVAMLPRVFYCQTDNGILTIDFRGVCKETGLKHAQKEAWEGYTELMLERRAKRGADVPTWFTAPKQESDWSAEFLDYVTGAEPSEAVKRKLEEMRVQNAA